MKRKVLFLKVGVLVSILTVCGPERLWAAVNKDHDVLIKNFAVALKNNDQQELKGVLKVLDENNPAVLYMEEHYPKVYISYRWQQILDRLYDLQVRYGQREEYIPSSFAGKTTTKRNLTNNRVKSSSRDKFTNRNSTQRYSNSTRLRQNRTTIGQVASRSPNQVRTPNNTRSVRRSR